MSWAARGPVRRSVAARGDNVSTMPRHELRKDARKPPGSLGTRLCPTGPWLGDGLSPERGRIQSQVGSSGTSPLRPEASERVSQAATAGHRSLDGEVAGAP